jgi:hypothetical protein
LELEVTEPRDRDQDKRSMQADGRWGQRHAACPQPNAGMRGRPRDQLRVNEITSLKQARGIKKIRVGPIMDRVTKTAHGKPEQGKIEREPEKRIEHFNLHER